VAGARAGQAVISRRPPRAARMATRRGAALTAALLAAVTAASFAIWLVPQGAPGGTIVVTDHAANLDGVEDRRAALAAGVSGLLEGVMAGAVSADEHAELARESAVIAKSELAGLLRTQAPPEWRASYAAAAESLRELGAYMSESIAVARAAERDGGQPETGRLEGALRASGERAAESLAARP